MPAQLSKGHTFHDGDTGVAAATLNSIVDSATILPGAITEQANAAPTVDDSFLFVDVTSGGLKRCTFQQAINLVPANSPASTAALRKLGVGANMAAPGNDSRFPARFRGIRVANGPAPDTAAVVGDLTLPNVNLTGAAHTVVDWSRGSVFYDSLSANKTYTFEAALNGQSIQLIIKKNGHTPTLPAAIGTVVVGTGTTFLHVFLTNTPLGTTGLQIAI
jgi:hypothetical protein